LEDFTQIFQKMPAVEHLLGLWSAFICSFEIASTSISTDHLNTWMSQQPVRENLFVAAQENFHWSVVL
jgi:hypothetical protein